MDTVVVNKSGCIGNPWCLPFILFLIWVIITIVYSIYQIVQINKLGISTTGAVWGLIFAILINLLILWWMYTACCSGQTWLAWTILVVIIVINIIFAVAYNYFGKNTGGLVIA